MSKQFVLVSYLDIIKVPFEVVGVYSSEEEIFAYLRHRYQYEYLQEVKNDNYVELVGKVTYHGREEYGDKRRYAIFEVNGQ